jgi:hypothetical protein
MALIPGQLVRYRQGDGLPKLAAWVIRHYPKTATAPEICDLRVMSEDGESESTVIGSVKNADVGGWQEAV